MKRKGILVTCIVSLLALLSVPLTMDILYFSLPTVYGKTLYGAMKGKLDLIKESKGKKIVVIGGSSVPFSLDSSLIKEYLPAYTPIDFGLYASLGTNLMLDLASPYIGKEDIVIVSPEISSQTLSLYYDGLATHKALEQNKDMVWSLDGRMKEALLGAVPSFVGEKINYLRSTLPEPKDIYAASSFNSYGDIVVEREGNIMLDGVDDNHPITLDEGIIADDFLAKLNDFSKNCSDKGAKCYYRFSPMNDASIVKKDHLQSFYSRLESGLCFPILGDPYQAILEKEWFYDTNYHLNSAGAHNWTKQFIKDIKLTLDDASPTPIVEAAKPPLINPGQHKDGDNSFADYFAYEENGDEATVVSLTKQAERIVIPYRHNGKLITSFASSLFAGNQMVKEIVIQDNIRLLHDRSFAGSAISKIYLDNDVPSSIGVGDILLEGSNAAIYVHKENLTAYKTSYAWAKYAKDIHEWKKS